MDTNENTNQEKNPLNELEEKVIENRTDSPKSRQKRKNIINTRILRQLIKKHTKTTFSA